MKAMKSFTYIVKELEDWEKLAEFVLRNFSDKKIFLLFGNIGAGKTTLVQAFGKIFKVKEHITSPTFSIMQEYHCEDNKTIYHFDLYRLKSISELKDIGFEDFLYSDNYCFVEWPEIAKDILDEMKEKCLNIEIIINDKMNNREVKIFE
jgi:tRNA threonylcarbamoyladenosine biosynthesis protein TsaE